MQTLGNSTGFDLNQAIGRWRETLLARESITPDRVRELETHLRETFAELLANGLPTEEAFHLAARRLGCPDALAAEFDKQDPSAKWKRRVFWMLAGLLTSNLWNQALAPIWNLIRESTMPAYPSTGYFSSLIQFQMLLSGAGLAGLFLFMSRGRLNRLAAVLGRRISTRGRLAAVLIGLYSVTTAFHFIVPVLWRFLRAAMGFGYYQLGYIHVTNWAFFATTLVGPALTILLLARLAPLPADTAPLNRRPRF
ncbi:MAG TPA: permease prefix domain 1-containing protein [Verrucomicrobiae bacterium]|nr:permease prefix domain 1-containing protein [Verrucomicrobiae bacterium]